MAAYSGFHDHLDLGILYEIRDILHRIFLDIASVLFRQDFRHISWLPTLACISTIATTSQPGINGTSLLRMNQIQIVATHNSYHIENNATEKEYFRHLIRHPEDYYYTHAPPRDQLDHQQVRGFEFDIWADSAGGRYTAPIIRQLTHGGTPGGAASSVMDQPGAKVFHISDLDVRSTCYTLVDCLQQVKEWSDAHPAHVPIPILLEFKTAGTPSLAIGGVQSEEWNPSNLAFLDREIRSVFPEERMITPDDVRRNGLTLEQSVLKYGWPALDESRGKVFFLMDNSPNPGRDNVRDAYRMEGHGNLEGRIIFTNSLPGRADCAFVKRNIATGHNFAEIQQLVQAGYMVRTRADQPIWTVVHNDVRRREAAFASGAQIVSTDFPAVRMSERYDSDYVCRLPGKKVARCNPVNGPCGCKDEQLE